MINENNKHLAEDFYDDIHIERFKNIFAFMNFCYKQKLTPENSITHYDGKYMYIKSDKINRNERY